MSVWKINSLHKKGQNSIKIKHPSKRKILKYYVRMKIPKAIIAYDKSESGMTNKHKWLR